MSNKISLGLAGLALVFSLASVAPVYAGSGGGHGGHGGRDVVQPPQSAQAQEAVTPSQTVTAQPVSANPATLPGSGSVARCNHGAGSRIDESKCDSHTK